jgi:hypothetical protein
MVTISYANISKCFVFQSETVRRLYGDCTETVRRLYGDCTATVRVWPRLISCKAPTDTHAPLHSIKAMN